MTDPNKAAVTESNADFLVRMKHEALENDVEDEPDFARLIALAEERVMIEEHKLHIDPPDWTINPGWITWRVFHYAGGNRSHDEYKDLSTALRSVVAKIGGDREQV